MALLCVGEKGVDGATGKRPPSTMRSGAMLRFKSLHGLDKCLHAFEGHGIVDRGTESADRTVALDAVHAASRGESEEFGFEGFVTFGHDKADIHVTAIGRIGDGAAEEGIAIDFAVEEFGTLTGATLHFGYPTPGFDPTEGLQTGENGHNGRRVEHAAFVNVRAIVDHCGERTGDFAQDVVAHNDECDAGHGEIFLCTGINEGIFRGIDHAREDVARHVGHKGNGRIEIFMPLGAVDGIVGGDMEVIGVGGHGEILGEIGVVRGFRGGNFHNFTEKFGLFEGLLCPSAGVEIGGFAFEEVIGDVAELGGGSATEEDHTVIGRELEQFGDERAGFVDHGLEIGTAVADFHEGKVHAVEIDAGFCCGADHFLGKNGRAGAEIVLFHDKMELEVAVVY